MTSSFTVSSVSKVFRRPSAKRHLWSKLLSPEPPQKIVALDQVSLTVPTGHWLGVIGPNGSGKSTLAKLLVGVMHPTSGGVQRTGKVVSVLGLGAGFHPYLTGHENLFLNGLVLGLTRKQIQDRYDEIVAFGELGEVMHTPIRFYSSGMRLRLGLSIVTHTDADTIVLDEVLTAGDRAFRAKSLERLQRLKEHGTTVVLVSHGLKKVAALCDTAVYLDKGQIQAHGPAARTVDAYRDQVATGNDDGELL